ncbi:hypothetical protein CA13_62500 [Planctomycetes bacterium CA13]|uniref:Uncharacterized protein n=1 Tax=Novipirellula herctigrandis TaxID=2527986 RepID=A0A5C5ZC94_9BACT|nr:hypothetical protein CA13_62500 [Planctomycetes bacterium CA13]
MKRTLYCKFIGRMSLSAAFAVTGAMVQLGHADQAVADTTSTATATDAQNENGVSKFYDADFDEHVDVRVFGVAFSNLDARLMTDVALQLREAEKVLGRKHKMMTSDQMLQFAAKMASESKDAETLERLTRVAKASSNSERADELSQMASLAANSRDMRNDAMFSAMDVERGALAAFANLLLQIRDAELSGDKSTLDSLRKATENLESLRDTQRNRLYGLIDDAEDLVGGGNKDQTSDLLRSLSGNSRDFSAGTQMPQTEAMVQVATPQEDTAAMVIDGGQGYVPPPSRNVSYAAGGMNYLMTPSGAVVQTHGRLGTILFQPGDVIISLGGVPMGRGRSVDSGVNSGYITGNRSVVVRDRNSGRVLTVFF